MSSFLRELVRVARLAAPVAVTQLSLMMLWVVDTVMLFEFGVEAQDAAALGRVWVTGTTLVGAGILLGLDPVMAQAFGARDARRLGHALQQGFALCLAFSVPVGLSWFWTEEILSWSGQAAELTAEAERYAVVQLPALPFFLAFGVLRQYLNCRSLVLPPLIIALVANVLNVGLNWVFVFGHLGAPALGATGAGVATALVEAFTALALAGWIVTFGLHRDAWHGFDRRAWNLLRMGPVLALGIPVGLQIGLELWAFHISTLWAGKLGDGILPLAAHNIAMQFASISFMVPLGVSIGAATRVGNLIGAGRQSEAQLAAWSSFALGGGIMALFGVVLVFGRERLPDWYTDDAAVIALTASILPIAATFQVVDGLQVVGTGILRGMGRTRPAALFHFVAFYVLALPLAWWLSFELAYGLRGIWIGLGTALGTASLCVIGYVKLRGPRTVHERVRG